MYIVKKLCVVPSEKEVIVAICADDKAFYHYEKNIQKCKFPYLNVSLYEKIDGKEILLSRYSFRNEKFKTKNKLITAALISMWG